MTDTSGIKAIMVDVDGVLVGGRPADGRPWASELKADLALDPDELHRVFFARYWDAIVAGRLDLPTPLSVALAEIAPHLNWRQVTSYWFAQDSRINEGLLGRLNHYRRQGVSTFLATNQEHLRMEHLAVDLGLSRHFDGIFYSAKIGYRKPERDFFEAVTTMTGLAPNDILLIDDTQANVDAAKLIGWNVICWSGRCDLETELDSLSLRLPQP